MHDFALVADHNSPGARYFSPRLQVVWTRDFSPAAVARKVDALNKLLQARTQLSNLLTYMDGKSGAEELIAKTLNDPTLLQALVSAPKPGDEAQPESTPTEEQ